MLFLHIPKTAGSSLRDSLAQVYRTSDQLYLYEGRGLSDSIHVDDFAGLPEAERARPRLIAGHFYYGLHADVPGPSRYVTIVRDPVDRIASLYHHYRRVAGLRPESRAGVEGRSIIDQEMTLEDWGFGLRRVEIDNEIIRRVTGQQSVPFGHCGDDLLTEALANVEGRFAEVLVAEQLDVSKRSLERSIGARIPALERVNVNEERTPLGSMDRGEVARVRELNRLDIAFYEAMVDRLGASARA